MMRVHGLLTCLVRFLARSLLRLRLLPNLFLLFPVAQRFPFGGDRLPPRAQARGRGHRVREIPQTLPFLCSRGAGLCCLGKMPRRS